MYKPTERHLPHHRSILHVRLLSLAPFSLILARFPCLPFLKTFIIILASVDGLQNEHVELLRITTGTVAARSSQPWPALPLLLLLVLLLLLLLGSEILIAFGFAFAMIKIARLKVGRRTGDGGLDRVVRIVPDVRASRSARWTRDATAAAGGRTTTATSAARFEQQKTEIVPLEVRQLLVEVLRQRGTQGHLEPSGRPTGRAGRCPTATFSSSSRRPLRCRRWCDDR